jgi:hypothetical protein
MFIRFYSTGIGTAFFKGGFLANCDQSAVLRIRVRDPVLFYPKDPGSGRGMIFFPNSGSLPRSTFQFVLIKYVNLQDFTLRNGEKDEKLNLL